MHRADDEFAEFMRGRYPALVRAGSLLVGDTAAGEDLVQAALTKTAMRWDRLADKGAAEAYTRMIMVRLAARWGQRRWSGEVPTARLPEAAGPDDADRMATQDALARALRALPYQQRAVVVLRYYQQLSERETADALDCSLGTVKSRANRALEALRQSGLLSDPDHAQEVRHDA
ncbi:MAG: polymerase sigma-E factor [Frankiales bacterium]|nr:polymerase sigma-E factor [Frankiales bacterium]